ncbi:MAG TPA: hypothetical protein DHV18_03435, partial [Brochothrix thermosphacta]|nr:hypothetical protein [Brochothrix thermosphacta]
PLNYLFLRMKKLLTKNNYKKQQLLDADKTNDSMGLGVCDIIIVRKVTFISYKCQNFMIN